MRSPPGAPCPVALSRFEGEERTGTVTQEWCESGPVTDRDVDRGMGRFANNCRGAAQAPRTLRQAAMSTSPTSGVSGG